MKLRICDCDHFFAWQSSEERCRRSRLFADGGSWEYPSFPGCSSQGETVEEALEISRRDQEHLEEEAAEEKAGGCVLSESNARNKTRNAPGGQLMKVNSAVLRFVLLALFGA